jgi:hypothetical protein
MAIEARHYQEARDGLAADPLVRMMAAGVTRTPLAELADGDGGPRFEFMQAANAHYDRLAVAARARGYDGELYPADAPRHIGAVAEAVLAERARTITAFGEAFGVTGEAAVLRVIARLDAGEDPVMLRANPQLALPGRGSLPAALPGSPASTAEHEHGPEAGL